MHFIVVDLIDRFKPSQHEHQCALTIIDMSYSKVMLIKVSIISKILRKNKHYN